MNTENFAKVRALGVRARAALESPDNRRAIVDTIWAGPAETLGDLLDEIANFGSAPAGIPYEYLRCPFCGAGVSRTERLSLIEIRCRGCDISLTFRSDSQANEIWNSRAEFGVPEPEPQRLPAESQQCPECFHMSHDYKWSPETGGILICPRGHEWPENP